MRRKHIKITFSIVTIVILLFGIINIYQNKFLATPNVIQTCNSPDGKYIAYLYESNGGATSGYVYHISIIKNGKLLSKGNGNIYINTKVPPKEIRWISNNQLYVDDYNSIHTKKQEQSIYDITILYSSLESDIIK